jgi:hypothetical protein
MTRIVSESIETIRETMNDARVGVSVFWGCARALSRFFYCGARAMRDDNGREGRRVVSLACTAWSRTYSRPLPAFDGWTWCRSGGQYQEFIEKIKHPKCADLARAQPQQPHY